MRPLKIEKMGDAVQGVTLRGDRKHPEPIHFRVSFPGGDVEVVRAADGDASDYWVHVRVNTPEDREANPERSVGKLLSARLDVAGKHAGEAVVGDFGHPGLYHLAVRVGHTTE